MGDPIVVIDATNPETARAEFDHVAAPLAGVSIPPLPLTAEWPNDLRVQEFPVIRNLAAVRGEEVADG